MFLLRYHRLALGDWDYYYEVVWEEFFTRQQAEEGVRKLIAAVARDELTFPNNDQPFTKNYEVYCLLKTDRVDIPLADIWGQCREKARIECQAFQAQGEAQEREAQERAELRRLKEKYEGGEV